MYSTVVVQEVLQRRWEPWRWAECPAIGSWQWPLREAGPLPTTGEVAQELRINHSMVIWFSSVQLLSSVWLCDPMDCSTPGLTVHHQLTKYLKQIGKVKKLDKWVPHELTKKNVVLKCHLFLFCATTTNDFSIRLWHERKRFYVKTSSVAEPRCSSKALPKAKLAPKKKGSWSLFGGLLPVWSTTTFWIPVKPLHLTSMLSKSIRCTKMPAANIGEQKGPSSSPRQCLITRHTTSTSKAQRLGYNILPYVPCSPDFLPTDYHFFKHLDFLQGKCFHNQQEAKNAFQKFVKS